MPGHLRRDVAVEPSAKLHDQGGRGDGTGDRTGDPTTGYRRGRLDLASVRASLPFLQLATPQLGNSTADLACGRVVRSLPAVTGAGALEIRVARAAQRLLEAELHVLVGGALRGREARGRIVAQGTATAVHLLAARCSGVRTARAHELVAVVGGRILRAVAKTAGALSRPRWRGAAGARRVRGRKQGHGHDHRHLRRLDGDGRRRRWLWNGHRGRRGHRDELRSRAPGRERAPPRAAEEPPDPAPARRSGAVARASGAMGGGTAGSTTGASGCASGVSTTGCSAGASAAAAFGLDTAAKASEASATRTASSAFIA